MIWNVAYLVGSAVGSGGVARPGPEGIVSRPRLAGRLATPARVTVVSGPPGNGKTVRRRSWISQAGAAGGAAWVPARRDPHDPQRSWLSVLAAPRQTDPGRRGAAADRDSGPRCAGRVHGPEPPPATDEDRRQERPRNR